MSKKPDQSQFDIEAAYPNIAEWVRGSGWIEIGDQGWRGFAARALYEDNIACETDTCRTLAEAMAALENGLGEWNKENG